MAKRAFVIHFKKFYVNLSIFYILNTHPKTPDFVNAYPKIFLRTI